MSTAMCTEIPCNSKLRYVAFQRTFRNGKCSENINAVKVTLLIIKKT